MYYSVYDRESGVYLHTGRNSTSREECVRDVVAFYAEDMEDSDADIIMCESIDTQEGFLMQAGYYVEEHEELITDDGWWEDVID